MTDGTGAEPKLVSLFGMYIIGWEVRTTNRDEMNAPSAKISALWQRVREGNLIDTISEPKSPGITLGAYTRYQSDDKGPYSLVLGAEVDNVERVPAGMAGITVLAQEYLVFTATGNMPGAVISAWGEVWRYFSGPTVFKRAYTTDFERYDTARPSEVDIYIAVR